MGRASGQTDGQRADSETGETSGDAGNPKEPGRPRRTRVLPAAVVAASGRWRTCRSVRGERRGGARRGSGRRDEFRRASHGRVRRLVAGTARVWGRAGRVGAVAVAPTFRARIQSVGL